MIHALVGIFSNCSRVRETGKQEAGKAFTLITQNVDDLHQRAGSQVLPMHGQLTHLKCERCGHSQRDLEHVEPDKFVPCNRCANPRLRPDIVWFGEIPYHLDEIEDCMVGVTHFVAIGTSGVVYPAAGLLSLARAQGAKTWVNGLAPPQNLHPHDRFVRGPAADLVPLLLASLLDS